MNSLYYYFDVEYGLSYIKLFIYLNLLMTAVPLLKHLWVSKRSITYGTHWCINLRWNKYRRNLLK